MKYLNNALKELQQIPGVGPSIARDFIKLGIFSIADLKNKNPEKLYADLCALEKVRIDRCILYVFRLAVYYASHTEHDPRLLQWWAWKDS